MLPTSRKIIKNMVLPTTVEIGVDDVGRQYLKPVVTHVASFLPEVETQLSEPEVLELKKEARRRSSLMDRMRNKVRW